MFEGEERWSRNCGSGIGLSNYKNVFRDDILVGNWQEDLYGNRINPDTTHAEQEPAHYLSATMNDFDRKQIDPDRARGGSNVESMPYELLFGHGQELYGDTRAANADASVSETLTSQIPCPDTFETPAWRPRRPSPQTAWM